MRELTINEIDAVSGGSALAPARLAAVARVMGEGNSNTPRPSSSGSSYWCIC